MAPLPIALATSSPERRQRNLARGIAETLDDSIELARRFRERRSAGQPHVGGVRAPVAATLEDSKRLAERFSERTRHDIATTLEESRQLAERWRARTAPSVARTLAESYDLARRFERGQLRPAEPYRPPLPQGRPLLPRTLDDSLAFAARRPTATTSASLADAKAAAARFGARSQAANARYNVNELVKGPLLRGPDAVVEEPQGPTLRTRGGLLLDEPVTFRNALWTEYPVVSLFKGLQGAAYVDFIDVAAGGDYVWAVSSLDDVYVLRPGSSVFERADGAPAATRVAVLSDGSPVIVTSDHRIEIGRRAGEHWIDLSLYSSLAQSPVAAIDVGAGDAQDDYPYGQIAVTLMDGRVFSFQHGFVPVDGGITIAAIALARNGAPRTRSSDGAPLYTLWAVGKNGDLFVGPGWQYADGFPVQVEALQSVPAPFAAADVGVDNQGVAFVTDSSGDAWQLDTFGNRWLDTRGKAKAIAAGPDGSMWIVGQDGTLYNRGGRKFGFWELSTRSRPSADNEDWCVFHQEVAEATAYADALPASTTSEIQAVSDAARNGILPSLWQEGVNRFVEGGASILRVNQSLFGAFSNGEIQERLQILVAASLGIDVLVLFDVIRTKLKLLPIPEEFVSFDKLADWFNARFDNFRYDVDALLQDAGFPQRFEDVVKYISIGGEVDVYFGVFQKPAFTTEWSKWVTFYAAVADHIRLVAPRVKVGCVLTLLGTTIDHMDGAQYLAAETEDWPRVLNASSDYAGFTTYPNQDINVKLDDPNAQSSSAVKDRFSAMLHVAGDLPVVIEEYGYPTYDDATKSALEQAWLSRTTEFPSSFFSPGTDGRAVQSIALADTFDEWNKAKLRIPVIIWLPLFEMHVEGVGCNLPCVPDPNPGYYSATACSSCAQDTTGSPSTACPEKASYSADCHPCGPGEGLNSLGTGVDERGARFFGSSGLIQSNGRPKPAPWDTVVAWTTAMRAPRGA